MVETAIKDFGTLRSVPDLASFDLEQAKAVLGPVFNEDLWDQMSEAGKVSKEVLQAVVGDFPAVDFMKLAGEVGIDTKQLQKTVGAIGDAMKVVSDAAPDDVAMVMDIAGKEAMKMATNAGKVFANIPLPAVGTALGILSAIGEAIQQARYNQRNATAAWGRLRVIQTVLISIDADVQANGDFASSAGHALQAMRDSTERVALVLSQLKTLIESYCYAPPKESKAKKSWIPCWDTITGVASYVKDTVVQMVMAESFAEAFEEHMWV